MNVAVLLLFTTVGQGTVQDAPPVVHERRLDEVGQVDVADISSRAVMTIRHRTLAVGSFAELTALDTGRTIIALVEPAPTAGPGVIGILSPSAARALGLADGTQQTIRIRPAAPSPGEQAAIRAGQVVTRLDAPSSLLAGLRRRVPSGSLPVVVATPRPQAPLATPPTRIIPRPTTMPPAPAPATRPTGRWIVQVAAFSDAARAASLAKSVDGVVRSAGSLYRVQAGPFATRAAAESARAAIARRGFGDARIIAQD